jgi:hypothetical protein
MPAKSVKPLACATACDSLRALQQPQGSVQACNCLAWRFVTILNIGMCQDFGMLFVMSIIPSTEVHEQQSFVRR